MILGKHIDDQRGFTLAESMVAVAILGIALGACVMSFSMAIKAVATGRNQMAAVHYARDELEGLRTYKFSNSVLNASTYTISNAYYKGSYTVSNVDAYTKDVTMRIVYQNRIKGGNSTNTLITTLVQTLHK